MLLELGWGGCRLRRAAAGDGGKKEDARSEARRKTAGHRPHHRDSNRGRLGEIDRLRRPPGVVADERGQCALRYAPLSDPVLGAEAILEPKPPIETHRRLEETRPPAGGPNNTGEEPRRESERIDPGGYAQPGNALREKEQHPAPRGDGHAGPAAPDREVGGQPPPGSSDDSLGRQHDIEPGSLYGFSMISVPAPRPRNGPALASFASKHGG